jgi:flagellar motility protein MotE (MotC chaperone)
VIVTRQRKKKRNLRPLILPVLALAALVVALAWPPSHNVIANGPLKPAYDAAANAGGVVARPLSFAAQQQTITDRNREIRALNAQLEKQRQDKANADTRIHQLEQQANAAAAQPVASALPAPRRTPSIGGAFAPNAAGNASATPSPEEKRVAATWAAMDAEKAAAVVQRLPENEATRILEAMDADSAAEILNALPPAVAARISRATAQVSSTANR